MANWRRPPRLTQKQELSRECVSLFVCVFVQLSYAATLSLTPKTLADFVDFGDLPPNVRMTVANCQRAVEIEAEACH